MTLHKGYRRQTWLINLLILMLLVVGGIGLFGLAQSRAVLDAIYAQRVLAMAQLAHDVSPAAVPALVQQQADMAREDLADAARLHGHLRAAILLSIVLGIGCAAAFGSSLQRSPPPAETEAAEAEKASAPPVVAAEPLPTEPPTVGSATDWDGSNRRGPNRARNVARIPKKSLVPDGSATRDDRREATDDWEPF